MELYLSEQSSVMPVKSKNLRYSSATSLLNSLLKKSEEISKGYHSRVNPPKANNKNVAKHVLISAHTFYPNVLPHQSVWICPDGRGA